MGREARRTLGGTTGMLLLAYIASGYGAVFFEQVRPACMAGRRAGWVDGRLG